MRCGSWRMPTTGVGSCDEHADHDLDRPGDGRDRGDQRQPDGVAVAIPDEARSFGSRSARDLDCAAGGRASPSVPGIRFHPAVRGAPLRDAAADVGVPRCVADKHRARGPRRADRRAADGEDRRDPALPSVRPSASVDRRHAGGYDSHHGGPRRGSGVACRATARATHSRTDAGAGRGRSEVQSVPRCFHHRLGA